MSKKKRIEGRCKHYENLKWALTFTTHRYILPSRYSLLLFSTITLIKLRFATTFDSRMTRLSHHIRSYQQAHLSL
jgi:hypothetical protein